MKPLRNEQEHFLLGEELLSRARYVLVGRVLGDTGKRNAVERTHVRFESDKVEVRGDEDECSRGAYGGFEERW